MEKINPVRVVDLPEFEEIKGKEAGETLCNLFQYLIPEDMERPVDIDPRKIKCNHEDCKKLISSIQDEVKDDQELKVALMWMNQGPSANRDIPPNKIYLQQGFMQPAEKKAMK